jgi:hypothetical protein
VIPKLDQFTQEDQLIPGVGSLLNRITKGSLSHLQVSLLLLQQDLSLLQLLVDIDVGLYHGPWIFNFSRHFCASASTRARSTSTVAWVAPTALSTVSTMVSLIERDSTFVIKYPKRRDNCSSLFRSCSCSSSTTAIATTRG